jgi:hypothetical protein
MEVNGERNSNILAAIKGQQIPFSRSTTLIRDHVLEHAIILSWLHSRPESLDIIGGSLVWGSSRDNQCALKL